MKSILCVIASTSLLSCGNFQASKPYEPLVSADTTVLLIDTVDILERGSGDTNPIRLGSKPMLARGLVSVDLPTDIYLGDIKTTSEYSFILKASAPLLDIQITSSDTIVYPVSPSAISSMEVNDKATGLVPILKVKAVHGNLGDLDAPVITAANKQVTITFSGKMLDTIKQWAVRTYIGHTDNGNGKSNDVPITDTIPLKALRVDTVPFQGISYVLTVNPLYLDWAKRWHAPSECTNKDGIKTNFATLPVKGILSTEHSTGCTVQTEVRGNARTLDRVSHGIGIDTVAWGATIISDCVVLRNQNYPVMMYLPEASTMDFCGIEE